MLAVEPRGQNSGISPGRARVAHRIVSVPYVRDLLDDPRYFVPRDAKPASAPRRHQPPAARPAAQHQARLAPVLCLSFCALPRIAGEAEWLDIADVVCATSANGNDVVNRYRRLPPRRKRYDIPVPLASGASGVLRQQAHPLLETVLPVCLKQARPATLSEDVSVAVLAGRKESAVTPPGELRVWKLSTAQVADAMCFGMGEAFLLPGSAPQDFRKAE